MKRHPIEGIMDPAEYQSSQHFMINFKELELDEDDDDLGPLAGILVDADEDVGAVANDPQPTLFYMIQENDDATVTAAEGVDPIGSRE